jgi:hypothetical protein
MGSIKPNRAQERGNQVFGANIAFQHPLEIDEGGLSFLPEPGS